MLSGQDLQCLVSSNLESLKTVCNLAAAIFVLQESTFWMCLLSISVLHLKASFPALNFGEFRDCQHQS